MWDARERERGWWFVEDRVSSLSFPHYNWSFFPRKMKHSFYLENFQDRLFTGYMQHTFSWKLTFESTAGSKRHDGLPAGLPLVTITRGWMTRNAARGRACLAETTAQRQKNTKHQLCIRERCSVNDHSRCNFVYTHTKISLPTICVQPWKHSLISQKESALIILQIRNFLGNVAHSTYRIKTAQEGFIDPDFGKTSLHIPCYLV